MKRQKTSKLSRKESADALRDRYRRGGRWIMGVVAMVLPDTR